MSPIASVVVPAHDEQAVIERCLTALATGTRPGELEIVVVANACHDDTAAVAKAAGAVVLETPIAGKANAIRLGDGRCATFPRLYLDADSELTGAGVRAMVAALAATGAPACAPTPDFDATGAPWPVRGFHRALRALLGERRSLSGAGAYMLSAAGHDRVFPMPDVLADDGWVHRTFQADERIVVPAARVAVRLPRSVAAVIRRRARVRLGNQELSRLGRPATEAPLRPGALVGLVRRREVAPADAACFLGVLFAERVVARWRAARGTSDTWSPDLTTRGEST
ncbi:MAG TPA: glycosyltransferase [Pseudonocardiaceae bacterium]|nr:glycosyltransferase [Pseudonocardiaceae bacterium]